MVLYKKICYKLLSYIYSALFVILEFDSSKPFLFHFIEKSGYYIPQKFSCCILSYESYESYECLLRPIHTVETDLDKWQQIHLSGFVWSVCHRLLALVGDCFGQLNLHLSALRIFKRWHTGRLSALVCVWWCGVNWDLVVTVFLVDSLLGLMPNALESVVCLEILFIPFQTFTGLVSLTSSETLCSTCPCSEPQESVNKDRICVFGWTVPLTVIIG